MSSQELGITLPTDVVSTAPVQATRVPYTESKVSSADTSGSTSDAVAVEIRDSARVLSAFEHQTTTGDQPTTTDKGEAAVSLKESDAKQVAEQFKDTLNDFARSTGNTRVQFNVDYEGRSSNQITFRVVDVKTGEVVQEYPPDRLLKHLSDLKTNSAGKTY